MSWADVGRPAFDEFESRFRIHLKQILTLDKKPPVHAATLLILVAYEAIAKLFERGEGEDLFADELSARRGLPVDVGRVLYVALRNGLAHSYRTHRIVLGREEVRPSLAWKAGPHLAITGVQSGGIHDHIVPADQNQAEQLRICVVVSELWTDLEALFRNLRASLAADPALASGVEERARTMLRADEDKSRPEGPALAAWRRYVQENRWEGAGA
jgi:hypothetical protein